MTGPNCLKVLSHIDLLLELLNDVPDVKSKFQIFFGQFNSLISFMFTTQPLRAIDLEEEFVWLHGPSPDNHPNDPTLNDLYFFKKLCRDHGD